MSFFGKPPVFDWAGDDAPTYHFEIALTPRQRQLLIKLTAHQEPKVSIRDRNYLVALLKNAKRHDGAPLPDASLDWKGLSAEARRQGCSEVDVLWDRAQQKDPS